MLILNLQKLNFEIITLGECNIFEKTKLLSDINILITQTGGNMYNLIFSNTPKHILFLSNSHPLYFEYINVLLTKLNFYTNHSNKLFSYDSSIIHCDKKNVMNDPFIVNVEHIVKYCYDLINKNRII